jgi:hypothetical protein
LTCYYGPLNHIKFWFFKNLSDTYETTLYQNITSNIKLQNTVKNSEKINISYIAENYFIGCEPNHKIIEAVYNILIKLWTAYINSKPDLCTFLNNHMILYLKKFFIFDAIIEPEKELDCSYFFNYMELTDTIMTLTEKYSKSFIPIMDDKMKLKLMEILACQENIDKICEPLTDCKHILLSNDNDNILLLSATYIRYGKYSDIRKDRLSWNNTCLGEIIDDHKENVSELISILKLFKFYQLKFSSYTRDSPIIELLKNSMNKK